MEAKPIEPVTGEATTEATTITIELTPPKRPKRKLKRITELTHAQKAEIEKCFKENGVQYTANKFLISYRTLHEICGMSYRTHLRPAGLGKRKRKQIEKELKMGIPMVKICKKFDIPFRLLYNIKKELQL